jgi:glycosyltransferase involved in cell wall biosynthesis
VQSVSVIVPTRLLAERSALLRRALESIHSQQGVRAIPIIVINGSDHDPELARELQADCSVRVTSLEQASLPAALHHGRQAVDTPWFAELDDDDILLPGALAARVRAFEESPECQVVVTNGVIRRPDGDTLLISDVSHVRRDPLRALVRRQWLLPGSWLCRTDLVNGSLFDGMPSSLECTWLAARFATGYRIRFLDQPTVVWHPDSPCSLSQSRDWASAQVDALVKIMELTLPPDVQRGFRIKVSEACHEAADWHWRQGSLDEAWRWHLRSLRPPGGWRYLPFTRRLIARWLRA